jgi:hypothetical protein
MAAAQVLPVSTVTSLDEAERERRRTMVDSALGTTLAEGVSPGPAVLALSERYVAGEISLQEFSASVLAMSGI